MNAYFTRGRVRFHAGRATLRAPASVPAGMVPGRVSILSPGTEQRRMAATLRGPGRDAGYMNIATIPDPESAPNTGRADDAGSRVHVVAPAPHGSAFDPNIPGAITAEPGAPLYVIAVARFQLIAARGLVRIPALPAAVTDDRGLDDVVVVGSGPVALGCVLELRRRGAAQIRVVTRRSGAPISLVPGVTCVDPAAATEAPLVVDAAGSPERAFGLVAAGGTLGLLGTPAGGAGVDSTAVHRSGVTVVGMHELADASSAENVHLGAAWRARYQDTYTAVVNWLINQEDQVVLRSCCARIPGDEAPEIYTGLRQGRRPPAPIVLWEWP